MMAGGRGINKVALDGLQGQCCQGHGLFCITANLAAGEEPESMLEEEPLGAQLLELANVVHVVAEEEESARVNEGRG
jgi:hypothetical protein